MEKKITKIKENVVDLRKLQHSKIKVCAYARVSTGSVEQSTSYSAQIEYYTEMITKNPLWEFCGVYADQGISGTATAKREEFMSMIEACELGEIDMIITKSITRFARNTVDCIENIRKLKMLGVDIYFEKENINTLSMQSEFLTTLYAAVAQGESENISSNIRWCCKKQFQDASYTWRRVPYGYQYDDEGTLFLKKKEAKIIRWIFDAYLNGAGTPYIAEQLEKQKILSPGGKERWNSSEIMYILCNPVYEGNTLYQKSYGEIQIPYKRHKNNGQYEQYLVEDSHPAIISHKEAEAVKRLAESKKITQKRNNGKVRNCYMFSGRIVCEKCGSIFSRKVKKGGKLKDYIYWKCGKYSRKEDVCSMTSVREDKLEKAFITMWNKLYTNQGTILEPMVKELMLYSKYTWESGELEKISEEIQNLSEQRHILYQLDERGYIDPALFMERNNQIRSSLIELRRKKELLLRRQKRTPPLAWTERLIEWMRNEKELKQEFEPEIFKLFVEKIIISEMGEIRFRLKSGLTLTEGGNKDV